MKWTFMVLLSFSFLFTNCAFEDNELSKESVVVQDEIQKKAPHDNPPEEAHFIYQATAGWDYDCDGDYDGPYLQLVEYACTVEVCWDLVNDWIENFEASGSTFCGAATDYACEPIEVQTQCAFIVDDSM